MHTSTRVLWALVALSMLIAACVWYAVVRESRNGLLTISFLDVGQGDAIFIDAPNGNQVLIDGGKDSSVLRALGRAMPWYDRSIDVVIPTHPDQDHIGGLMQILARFRVGLFVRANGNADTPDFVALEKVVLLSGVGTTHLTRGEIVEIGGGAYLEVLWPDRDVGGVETNTGCTVLRLVYGQTAFLLPCDAPRAVERMLVRMDGTDLRADVLKAGHHGSDTSSDTLLVGFANPKYVVYSRGCDNTYGHPHAAVKEIFARFGILVADTCTDGTVSFVSDGLKVVRR